MNQADPPPDVGGDPPGQTLAGGSVRRWRRRFGNDARKIVETVPGLSIVAVTVVESHGFSVTDLMNYE
jgi:hypothetical protein